MDRDRKKYRAWQEVAEMVGVNGELFTLKVQLASLIC